MRCWDPPWEVGVGGGGLSGSEKRNSEPGGLCFIYLCIYLFCLLFVYLFDLLFHFDS